MRGGARFGPLGAAATPTSAAAAACSAAAAGPVTGAKGVGTCAGTHSGRVANAWAKELRFGQFSFSELLSYLASSGRSGLIWCPN